ncbi:Rhs element Vgr protein [Pseudomonas sp. IT-P44]|uniref:T6SS phospholipase effector Tle1-like catalytic domain-containing protein n=1 Tax=Pseudomonas sp. IT-P44 TaxID=3026451 RepID=UPI0039E07FF8
MFESLIGESSPPPAGALVAPKFPITRRLPVEPSQLAKNIKQQKEDERRFGSQQRKLIQAQGGADSGVPCCKTLHITLAFDGTNNNDQADGASTPNSRSNIARIFHASLGAESDMRQAGFIKYYCPGVGTVFPDVEEYIPDQQGLVGARGGENRINWGLTRLLDALRLGMGEGGLPIDKTKLMLKDMATNGYANTFGLGLFESGAKKRETTLRKEIQDLQDKLKKRDDSGEKPHILAMRLYVYGFSRGAAEARTFVNWLQELVRCENESGGVEYRFAGLPISINFLGVFDTVAAVGLADSVPFAAGHMDWADGTMRLPDEAESLSQSTALPDDCSYLKRCVHLVSGHEQRASFPLDSIRRRPKTADGSRDKSKASSYRQGTVEYIYPGVHSDVGGGYPPNDQGKATAGSDHVLSQIALQHMYAEAFMAGAPLLVPKPALQDGVHDTWRAMPIDLEGEFLISETLINRFNAWQAQGQSGPLEEMMKREHALITGWRIDRYAGGVEKQSFFKNAAPDMPKAKIDAWKAIEERNNAEIMANNTGLPKPIYTEAQENEHQLNIQIVGGEEKVDKLRPQKVFEPPLDRRQLSGAAAEFRHDYLQEWGMVEDGFTLGGVADMLLGGTVYLINEEDEAEEYSYLYTEGTKRYNQMFSGPNVPRKGEEDLVALFDEQVHDSRAWFMNFSAAGPREPFTDYFRIRLVHFDNESNKQLSLLISAGRVIGLGIALASVGLSIKKRDPRMLLGLFLPSLARPVLSGKVGLPEISAFDPLTGIALPVASNLDALRAFTKEPGDLVAKVAALPPLKPLTEATANTPALQKILVAHQALEAVEAARKKDVGALAGMLANAANEEDKPSGWLDLVADQASNLKSSEKNV